MVISDRVDILLGIERAAQEERKVAVCSLDDVGNLVDRLATIESVLICEPVLDDVGEHDASTQRLGYTREKGRIHDRRAMGIGVRRHLAVSLALRGAGTKTGSRGGRWNGLINKRGTHMRRGSGGQGPRPVLQRAIATEGPRHGASGV